MNFTKNTAVTLLLTRIPEYKNSEIFNLAIYPESLGLPYVVFGYMSNYYIEEFLKKNTTLIQKISIFLEEMAASSDKEVVNILVVGFLENFSPFKPYFSEIKQTFGEKTQKLLDEIILRGQ